MTFRKPLTAVLAAGVLLSQSVRAAAAAPIQQIPEKTEILQQKALQLNGNNPAAANPNVIVPMAYGLIYDYAVSVRAGAGGVYLTARTYSRSTMKKIGIKSITLQYSANGISGWHDVAYYGDILNSNTTSMSITNRFYGTSNGAGYYRFKVRHYAYTNYFDPQEIDNVSNSVKLYY